MELCIPQTLFLGYKVNTCTFIMASFKAAAVEKNEYTKANMIWIELRDASRRSVVCYNIVWQYARMRGSRTRLDRHLRMEKSRDGVFSLILKGYIAVLRL